MIAIGRPEIGGRCQQVTCQVQYMMGCVMMDDDT
jgi:hypothetical protein